MRHRRQEVPRSKSSIAEQSICRKNERQAI
jgi:hypothetical protein